VKDSDINKATKLHILLGQLRYRKGRKKNLGSGMQRKKRVVLLG